VSRVVPKGGRAVANAEGLACSFLHHEEVSSRRVYRGRVQADDDTETRGGSIAVPQHPGNADGREL